MKRKFDRETFDNKTIGRKMTTKIDRGEITQTSRSEAASILW
jgi:hypothetical protein